MRRIRFAFRRTLPSTLAAVAAVAVLVLGASPVAALGNPPRSSPTFVAPGLLRQMQTNPGRQVPVIVQLRASATSPRNNVQAAQVALGLIRQNGHGGAALGIIRGASGAMNAAAITALAHDPRVAAIYEDVPVRRRDGTSPLGTAYQAEINATAVWQQGGSGRGVTVAVLDSGIAQDADLTRPSNRILTAVNFADQLPAGVQDPGGHGTHVAGIIAGNGTNSNGEYEGVAPNANLVDVRVLNAQGNGSASSVIAGLQWVVAHARDYGVRVVNLSFGAPSITDYEHDPIAAAAEIAWLRGLTVIAAAGNAGFNNVETPGIDPFVITVGGVDDNATANLADDAVPTWTAWGTPQNSTSKPDVVAPGRRIVSIRDAGSTLDLQLPDHVVTATNGATYFRLSGTSMATGVVSGLAALLLEAHPTLTPAQVKAILMGTAAPFGQSTGLTVPNPAVGRGITDAQASIASAAASSANVRLRLADPAANSVYQLLYGLPLAWKDPAFGGVDWTQQNWANLIWDDETWDNLIWDSFDWNNLIWDSLGWSDLIWDTATWSDLIWDAGVVATPLD